MQIIAYPFEPDPAKRAPEIPVSTCNALDLSGVTVTEVAEDLSVTTFTVVPSEQHDSNGRGAEFAPGSSANVCGVLLVHSGSVAIEGEGFSQDVGEGRWVLR